MRIAVFFECTHRTAVPDEKHKQSVRILDYARRLGPSLAGSRSRDPFGKCGYEGSKECFRIIIRQRTVLVEESGCASDVSLWLLKHGHINEDQ